MNRIKVTCEVSNYDEPAKESIKVESHWNRSEWVVITVGEKTYTVVGRDLIIAVENCMNTK